MLFALRLWLFRNSNVLRVDRTVDGEGIVKDPEVIAEQEKNAKSSQITRTRLGHLRTEREEALSQREMERC